MKNKRDLLVEEQIVLLRKYRDQYCKLTFAELSRITEVQQILDKLMVYAMRVGRNVLLTAYRNASLTNQDTIKFLRKHKSEIDTLIQDYNYEIMLKV